MDCQRFYNAVQTWGGMPELPACGHAVQGMSFPFCTVSPVCCTSKYPMAKGLVLVIILPPITCLLSLCRALLCRELSKLLSNFAGVSSPQYCPLLPI